MIKEVLYNCIKELPAIGADFRNVMNIIFQRKHIDVRFSKKFAFLSCMKNFSVVFFGNMGLFHFMILVQGCYKLVNKTRITQITSSTFDETEISTTTKINFDTDISTTLDETQSGYIHVHITRLFCCILFLPYTKLSNNCTCYR